METGPRDPRRGTATVVTSGGNGAADGGERRQRSPFSTSFQFRDDERAGMEALFERVFFDVEFSPRSRDALFRTRFDAPARSAGEEQGRKVEKGEAAAVAEAVDVPPESSQLDSENKYIVLYRGASGSGKTRIFRQFHESARRRQVAAYEVHYHDVEGIPFKPILHAIRSILQDHDRGAILQEKYRHVLAGLIPELFPEKPRLGPEPITPERLAGEKARLFDGITQLLLEVAMHKPLLLVVHDLHWSDVPTIELLRYIGRNLELRNRQPDRFGPGAFRALDGGPDVEDVEDVEWRDLSRTHLQTSDYLNRLLELSEGHGEGATTVPPARLMILANYRGFDDTRHYLEQSVVSLGREPFAYHGELRLLGRDEADQFVHKAISGVNIGGAPLELDDDAIDAIHTASEGFPSFLQEALLALYLDQGSPDDAEGGDVSVAPWVWTGERVRSLLSAGATPPESLARGETEASDSDAASDAEEIQADPRRGPDRRNILALRLRGASQDELSVLRVLAIARRPLTTQFIASVLSGWSSTDPSAESESAAWDMKRVVRVLESLRERGLVERSEDPESTNGGGQSFFFRLWDYVDVVSETISEADRRVFHQRMGEMRRAGQDENTGDAAYEVFYHLFRGDDARSSVPFGLAAARWFLRSLAFEKAREIYQSLAQLVPVEADLEQHFDIVDWQARISLALREDRQAEKLLARELEDGASVLTPERLVEFLLVQSEAARRRDPARALKIVGKAPRLLKDENTRLGARVQLQLARVRLGRQDIKRAINLCLKGRDICQKLEEDVPESGEFLREMANAFYRRGDYSHAVDNYQRALAVFDRMQLKDAMVATLDELGRVYLERGNYFRAARYLYRSLEIRRREQDIAGLCRSYDELGMVYLRSGDYLKTIENLNLSLTLKERVGDLPGLNPTLTTLGDLYSRLGFYERSIAYFQRAVANSQDLGDTPGLVEAFAHEARVYYELGDFKQAESLAKQVEILSTEFKLRSQEADGLVVEGLLRSRERDWTESEKKLRQALEIYGKLGHRRREASVLLDQAELKLGRELYDESLKVVSKGQILAEELKALDLQVSALVIKGNLHRFLKGGNVEKAREFFEKALELSQNLGDVNVLFNLFYSFAKLCHSEREFSEAANYYGKAELILKRVGKGLSEDLGARYLNDRRRKVFAEDVARFRKESLGRSSDAAVDLRDSAVVARGQDRPVGVADYRDLLTRILRVSSGLNQLHYYDRVLADFVELSGADRGFVLRVQNRQYIPVAFHGFGKDPAQHPEYLVASQLAQETIRKGRSILASGLEEDEEEKNERSGRQLDLGYLVHRSILAIPFLTDERILGAVYLDKPVSLGEFGPRDQVLLENFAEHAAVGLCNRREFETAIREPLTGFYTPSYFIDRLRETIRLFNLHGTSFALVGFYLPNLEEALGDGRGQLGGNLARELGDVLPSRSAVCWGSPILYVLIDEGDVPLVDQLAERLRARLAESLNDEVTVAVVPAARHFQQGVDLYLEIRAKLLPEECDQKTLSALRTVLAADVTLRDAKRIVEKQKIESTLRKTGGNITHAARELGIHRPQLSNLLKKHKLKRELFEQAAGESKPESSDDES